MPDPRAGENQDDFINRCMGDAEAVADFPDTDQRYAVCISNWEGKAEGHQPTAEMATVAERALEWRKEYNRGGTDVGVARARDIANRANLSADTVARMRSFFARHGVNRSEHYDAKEPDGGPTAWRIAWDLWGGDAGRTWADRIGRQEDEKSMTQVQHKAVSLEIKREPDEDGIFEGYASVFGVVDQGMDVVERGAFMKSLGSGRKVKMLWQHDVSQPIGVWDEIREDDRGLFVRGRLLKEVAKGREAMALLRAGALDSMSIGYRTIAATDEAGGRVRKLMEVELHEISLVTFPMLPDAKVTSVKSITTEREFEAFLRDAGYSRKEATAIALHGFKGLSGQRDAGSDEAVSEGVKALIDQLGKLKEIIHVRGH
jgi:HK97 family phage prohead protease